MNKILLSLIEVYYKLHNRVSGNFFVTILNISKS